MRQISKFLFKTWGPANNSWRKHSGHQFWNHRFRNQQIQLEADVIGHRNFLTSRWVSVQGWHPSSQPHIKEEAIIFLPLLPDSSKVTTTECCVVSNTVKNVYKTGCQELGKINITHYAMTFSSATMYYPRIKQTKISLELTFSIL